MAASLVKFTPDLIPAMLELHQRNDVGRAIGVTVFGDRLHLTNECQSRCFAAGIDLEAQGLQYRILPQAIHQPYGEWHHSMHPCPATRQ